MTDWSQIVQQHGPMVWRTVYRLLDHDSDAADCFQNTFLAAWKLSRSEPVRHWPGLLKRLAIQRALERLRGRYRETRLQVSLPQGFDVAGAPNPPGQAVEAKELDEDFLRALAELDPRQAQVFCLACLEGFTYPEIAEQLGLTANHVGVLLNRARVSLREGLRAHDPA